MEPKDLELIKVPGHRTISLGEMIQRISTFVNRMRGVEVVTIYHVQGAPLDELVLSRNVEGTRARELMRSMVKAIDEGKAGRDSPVVTPFSPRPV